MIFTYIFILSTFAWIAIDLVRRHKQISLPHTNSKYIPFEILLETSQTNLNWKGGGSMIAVYMKHFLEGLVSKLFYYFA